MYLNNNTNPKIYSNSVLNKPQILSQAPKRDYRAVTAATIQTTTSTTTTTPTQSD